MTTRVAGALAALAFLDLVQVACSHAPASHARDPRAVPVLRGSPPAERYEVIGGVVAEGALDEALEHVQYQAANLGGDMVILTLQAETGRRMFHRTQVQMTGDVIRLVSATP
jgi:hypothetical protein